jgi:sugar lactone lactonase YvrE
MSSTSAGTSSHALHALGFVKADPADIARMPQIRHTLSVTALPTVVDLSPKMPAVGDQGQEGSCVAWASAYALRGYEARLDVWSGIAPKTTAPANNFSAAFVYNQLNGGVDDGLTVPSALSFMVQNGVGTLADIPYVAGQYTTKPSAAAISDAKNYKLASYGAIAPSDLATIKTQLSNGVPVILAISVYYNFETLGNGQIYTGVSGPYMGGHAIVAVGYDDSKQAVEIINSWGTSWGTAGYGWISYTALNQIALEAYSAIDGLAPAPVPTATPTPKPSPTPTSIPSPTPAPTATPKPSPTPSILGIVTTFAGSAAGYRDATGTAAQFYFPYGVAADASGNLYVADLENNRVRKVTSAGVVTTLAGSGALGSKDGAGSAAQFDEPVSTAVDAGGNVYVVDINDSRIRKITATGVVTTLAGSGTQGFQDGPGASAQFNRPGGLAVDANGNVYVADRGNNRIRKITAAGVVTTLAGGTQGYKDGTGSAAQFSYPEGVAVDAAGNAYVADSGNNRIRKISPAGVVTTLAGSGIQGAQNGSAASAQFSGPADVVVDASGNLYVADSGNSQIRKITPAGVVSAVAGSGQPGYLDGSGANARFYFPASLAVNASGSSIYVADYGNNRIRRIQ